MDIINGWDVKSDNPIMYHNKPEYKVPVPLLEDKCDLGHTFYKLPDHPKDLNGNARCPYCMAIGIDKLKQENCDLWEQLNDTSPQYKELSNAEIYEVYGSFGVHTISYLEFAKAILEKAKNA